MYPQVVQFDTRRSQIARELQLLRERTGRARKGLEPAVGSRATDSSRLRRLLSGTGWSPVRRKVAIPRKSV